jgi:uncharacterized membrane protein
MTICLDLLPFGVGMGLGLLAFSLYDEWSFRRQQNRKLW